MALDVAKLRKLVALDENDPLSRFALGKKLFETESSPEALAEAGRAKPSGAIRRIDVAAALQQLPRRPIILDD